MSIKNRIAEIEREIEETKTDISWSDNEETIAVLEEKLENLNIELEKMQKQL